jgi:catechol 2,3-dioxygenase-like lactoylglutathione lyase family enzyme
MTQTDTAGIHHVTAIAGDPQRNLDFYAGTLGLRLVKQTVNFDDPGSYHLYFGDEQGQPGTILTFFPWGGGARGRQGTGQATVVALAIPPASLGYWLERVLAQGVKHEGPARRFEEQVLSFTDPDGLLVELVTDPRASEREGWDGGTVPAEHAIRYVHGVTIWEDGEAGTGAFLESALGYRRAAEIDNRVRYVPGGGGTGLVDLRRTPGFWAGTGGVGTIHHVAFRAADDAAQLAARERVLAEGAQVTPVLDRQYFHSIYFREPGGVLFEIATDPPGFAIDETPAALGTALRLPEWYEEMRDRISAALPPLHLPRAAAAVTAPSREG